MLAVAPEYTLFEGCTRSSLAWLAPTIHSTTPHRRLLIGRYPLSTGLILRGPSLKRAEPSGLDAATAGLIEARDLRGGDGDYPWVNRVVFDRTSHLLTGVRFARLRGTSSGQSLAYVGRLSNRVAAMSPLWL